MRSTLFDQQNLETEGTSLFTKQNSKMLKAELSYGEVIARQGAMVAYQGDANFEHEGAGGLKKMVKKALTGEGMPLMRVTGTGEVFFANMGGDVHIVALEGDRLSINGMNILAFSSSLSWDIEFIRGAGILSGGLFNTTLSGTGEVAVVTDGSPLVLQTDQPTFVDPDAAVAWSADLTISVQASVTFKSLLGRGSGEAAQLAFQGNGYVIVQPSENMRFGGEQTRTEDQQAGQRGLNLGGLLGN